MGPGNLKLAGGWGPAVRAHVDDEGLTPAAAGTHLSCNGSFPGPLPLWSPAAAPHPPTHRVLPSLLLLLPPPPAGRFVYDLDIPLVNGRVPFHKTAFELVKRTSQTDIPEGQLKVGGCCCARMCFGCTQTHAYTHTSLVLFLRTNTCAHKINTHTHANASHIRSRLFLPLRSPELTFARTPPTRPHHAPITPPTGPAGGADRRVLPRPQRRHRGRRADEVQRCGVRHAHPAPLAHTHAGRAHAQEEGLAGACCVRVRVCVC